MTTWLRLWRVAVAVVGLTAALGMQAQSVPDEAWARGALLPLEKADRFAMGGVGYAGTTSQGELNFRTVMAEPPQQALSLLEEVYAKGNLQAKAYALLGIRKLNQARFEVLAQRFTELKGNVELERGCIVSDEPIAQVIGAIRRGDYDIYPLPGKPTVVRG